MRNVQDDLKSLQKTMQKTMAEHHITNYPDLMHSVYRDPEVRSFINANRSRLSSADLTNSASKLYEFVSERNQIQNGHPGMIPGYVPKLTLSGHAINVAYRPTKEKLAQQKEAALRSRIHSIYIPKRIQNASLDDFYHDKTSRINVYLAAMKFISDYTQHPNQFFKGLYVYGKFGIGKTYLLVAIANRLAKWGVQTTLVHFPTFALEMKNSIQDNSTSDKIRIIEKAPVLMLDDIGADDMSAWIRDDVFSVILEYRMQNELPTFFSSNYSMQEFEDKHLSFDKHGDEEPLKAKRVMERIHFLSREYYMEGIDHRNPPVKGN